MTRTSALLAATALTAATAGFLTHAALPATTPRPVRVMVITAFDAPDHGETHRWVEREHLTEKITVPGLTRQFPTTHCNPQGLCAVTTGMGQANAAASITALVHSRLFDLKNTYFVVAGIAGISPRHGTLGTTAWADHVVDFSLAHEIDSRETPRDWPYGYFALGAARPGQPPLFRTGSETFTLNPALTEQAHRLSRAVPLADTPQAQRTRTPYGPGPASAAPRVTRCDTVTSNTFWSGATLSRRAEDWVKQFTHNKGTYCTTQMEDSAILTALHQAAAQHLVDTGRIAVLRAGSDFDQGAPGQHSTTAVHDHSGYTIAAENAYRTAAALVHDVTSHWSAWEQGPPSR